VEGVEVVSALMALAEKYCVDKLHSHSYIPVYEELFDGMDIRRVLEIGVGFEDLMRPFVPRYIHGASLKMWEEFWPEAQVFACDIRPDTLVNEGRIQSFVCDQSDPSALLDLVEKCGFRAFDVVIDDGSHQTEHQWKSLATLLSEVRKGGLYIIEDVSEPDKLLAMTIAARQWLEYKSVEVMRFDKRADDALLVVRR
jgi:hypothetical protein